MNRMRKIAGIIGGVGPESTIDYYRSILAVYRERTGDGSAPSLLIDSLNMKAMVALVSANELDRVADYLSEEIERLARAGAACALVAANTPHLVFDELRRRSPIPLISIVETTCAAAQALGLKKLGLFGARFTMQARFYPDVFAREGLAIVTPTLEEQAYIHDKYMNELVGGVFLDETRERLLEIADRMRERDQIDGLILGGTELPLILRDSAGCGIPFLDTTQIHVRALVAWLLN